MKRENETERYKFTLTPINLTRFQRLKLEIRYYINELMMWYQYKIRRN